MRKIRTVTIDFYMPFGTNGVVAADVIYRGQKVHKITGPKHTQEWALYMAKAWAYDNGFTHFRMLGEQGITLLEAPKCNTTH